LTAGDANDEKLEAAEGDIGIAVGRFKPDRGLVCMTARAGEVMPFLKMEVGAIDYYS
jgi:hypothetical protein